MNGEINPSLQGRPLLRHADLPESARYYREKWLQAIAANHMIGRRTQNLLSLNNIRDVALVLYSIVVLCVALEHVYNRFF